ncbi:MAG: PAS domain S-box protein [Methylotenera sp.]|uniref:PAS domain S-box protein n=1 Tax=Methylotenera sp. TaxID=2051956 RepID=UPI0024898D8B|nr:PAS domain S-box protein [Methylotenera sp.]MDI1308837.1 PAS domain S-box protein [Methylotenera sp.]
MKVTQNNGKTFQEYANLFDDIFENANIGTCLINMQGRIEKVNNCLCQVLGYCHSEMIHLSFDEITSHHSVNTKLEFIQRITTPNATQSSFEDTYIHKNGNMVFMEVFSSPIKNLNEQQPYFIVHMVDITERRNINNKLLECEEQLRTLYEHSPLGIALTDIHGNIVDANSAFSLICGYSKEELKTLSYKTLTPKSYEVNDIAQLESVKKTGKYGSYEKEYIRKDGALVPVLLNGVMLTDSKGNGYIWSFIKDIAEQRAMQKNLLLAITAIEKSKYAFFWIGSSGNVRLANDFASHSLGYAKDELLGKYIWDFDPDQTQETIAPIFDYIKQNELAIFESRHRRKDGSIFPVEVTANYFTFETEELVFCSVQDITLRKQTEKNLLLTQFAIDQSSVAVYQLDAEGRVLYANEVACRNLGYSAEELRMLGVSDIDILYNKDEWPKHWRILRNLKSLSFETVQKRKDGSTFSAEVSANYIAYEGMEYNFAFVRDISERKLVEKEIQLAATTFDSQEAIIVTDAEGNILRINKAFTKITGFTAEEAVGNKPSMFSSGYHDESFYQVMYEKLESEGFWQGEVWDKHKDNQIYPKLLSISAVSDATGNVSHYVGSFLDISERKKSEEEIYNLAFYDSLSKLPNRRLMIDRLDHALVASARNSQYGALLYLDIDHFKHLNDTKGHHYGDLLVIQIAERLKACLRESDTVARFGGDEFIIMLENISDKADLTALSIQKVCDKIVLAFNSPFLLEGFEYYTSASIGMTMFHGRESNRKALLTQADMAMYEAKKAGRNTQRFFDPAMQLALDARVALEHSLLKALPNNEFRLFYQLQVDSNAHPVGVEALIRWIHPERGLVYPMEFIPLAEEIRLIVAIEKWVLETACAQLKVWETTDIASGLSIAINISAYHFQQSTFVDDVRTITYRYGVSPNKLKLELTESIVIGDMQDAIAKMEQLKALGFILSMDDFGTGYSSLSYLRRLPFNQLKMDRSFIINALESTKDSFLIQMVTTMAAQFDMDVIAEGVETKEQQQHLIKLGCKAFQGYFFGKPMPVEALEAELMKNSNKGREHQ